MQRSSIIKEEASSPVVAAQSLLLSRVIDVKENHDVITLDALRAFTEHCMLEKISSKQIVLKICRVLVSMLCEIVPKAYKDFATCENSSNKILYTTVCGV